MTQHLVLCYNADCPQKGTCLRFTQEPRTEWTAFHDFTPQGERCEAYIPSTPKKEEEGEA